MISAGDLIYAEWQTLAQGSGLYVDKEYRVFKTGNPNPIISGGIPLAGRWGVNTALAGDVRVISFGSDHLLLQVNSSRSEGSGYKKPLFFFDEQYGEDVATIALRKVVKYAISQQGNVSVVDSHIYYQTRKQDSLQEVSVNRSTYYYQSSGESELNCVFRTKLCHPFRSKVGHPFRSKEYH